MYRRRRLAALLLILLIVAASTAVVMAVVRGDNAPPAATASPSPSTSAAASAAGPSAKLRLRLREVIASQKISPKSVVSTGNGYVFAQNMMYRHTMTVYDTSSLQVVKTIDDAVKLSDFGYPKLTEVVQGAPVEAAESPDHRFMYVSQYSMFGEGFSHPGGDVCSPDSGVDDSFVYRIPLDTLTIDQVIKVGAVPKFLAVTPDGKTLLVSNWCSYTLSVVDTATGKQVKSIYLGPYPRGIAVDSRAQYAYVAMMGGADIARIDLRTYALDWIRNVGAQPRHLVMSPDDAYLYATLNGEGKIARINLQTRDVIKVATGSEPRSMTISPDGTALFVVNYTSNTMSKVRTRDMKVTQVVNTNPAPIGITYDAPTGSIWVCCYGGSIMVFNEVRAKTKTS